MPGSRVTFRPGSCKEPLSLITYMLPYYFKYTSQPPHLVSVPAKWDHINRPSDSHIRGTLWIKLICLM